MILNLEMLNEPPPLEGVPFTVVASLSTAIEQTNQAIASLSTSVSSLSGKQELVAGQICQFVVGAVPTDFIALPSNGRPLVLDPATYPNLAPFLVDVTQAPELMEIDAAQMAAVEFIDLSDAPENPWTATDANPFVSENADGHYGFTMNALGSNIPAVRIRFSQPFAVTQFRIYGGTTSIGELMGMGWTGAYNGQKEWATCYWSEWQTMNFEHADTEFTIQFGSTQNGRFESNSRHEFDRIILYVQSSGLQQVGLLPMNATTGYVNAVYIGERSPVSPLVITTV